MLATVLCGRYPELYKSSHVAVFPPFLFLRKFHLCVPKLEKHILMAPKVTEVLIHVFFRLLPS